MTQTRTKALAHAAALAVLSISLSIAAPNTALAQGKVPAAEEPVAPPAKVPPATVEPEQPAPENTAPEITAPELPAAEEPATEPPAAETPSAEMPAPTAKVPAMEEPARALPDEPVEEEAPRPENYVELPDDALPAPEMAEPATADMPTEMPAPVADVPDVSDDASLMERIAAAQAQLEAGFEAGEGDAFRDMLAADPNPDQAMVLGQLLYMRRHFAHAAWFFAEAARNNPDNASALNNFGALLGETYANDPDAHPASWVRVGLDAVARANELRPGDPGIENNLGRGTFDLWREDADGADLDGAAAALTHATGEEDNNLVFLANQARILDAQGDATGAARALNRAHELDPTHPSLRIAETQVSPATTGAYAGAARNYCSIDYQCAQLCPPSIIGQINRVTCEMENSSANMACSAGEPYARAFNCAEQIPEFGILIPGLNAGFTVASPWGSFAAVVDGQGNVQWRIEAGPNLGPINPYIRVDGGYQPSGGWSVSDTRAGVKVNLVHGNPVGQAAGDYGYQPLYVQAEGSTANQSAEVTAGVYGNGTIIR